jgi:CRISPR-associated protein Cas2
MRIILFFDLPAVTRTDHREYSKFVKFIKTIGFIMYQESVYTKLALNETIVASTMKEVKQKLPKDGAISVLTITEKQFSSIENILGEIATDVIMSEDKVIKL